MTTESGLGYVLRPPKSKTSGRKPGQPTVVFIHTTEGSEGPTSAEDGAAYDARRTDGTSTHFFVDQNSVIQCVLTTDEAHAARAHGNDVGIQIEVCGRAGQTAAQWADAASAATIEQLARLCVKLRAKYPGRFPLTNLTPAQLRAGGHGFAEHLDATKAWPEDGGTHTDPGPAFPWARLFARIENLEAVDLEPKGPLAMLTDAQQTQLFTRVTRIWFMIRNLESLGYALARGDQARPAWADTETGYTFPAVPIAPNVSLAKLLGDAGVSEAELHAALAGAIPSAESNASALLDALGAETLDDVAGALRALLGPDRAAQLGAVLASAPPAP